MKYLKSKKGSLENSILGIWNEAAKKVNEKLVGGQKKLDKDKDGDIDAKDFAALRKSKEKKEGAKPDFLDIDKDGNKKEPMKKAAKDKEKMKEIKVSDDKAFSQLGRLYGKGILTERQLPVVKDQWEKPWHKDFEDKTHWSFYNACTEALKSVGPQYIMQRHMNLHRFLA